MGEEERREGRGKGKGKVSKEVMKTLAQIQEATRCKTLRTMAPPCPVMTITKRAWNVASPSHNRSRLFHYGNSAVVKEH